MTSIVNTIQYKDKILPTYYVTSSKWYNGTLYICINKYIFSTTDLINYNMIYKYDSNVPVEYFARYLNIVNDKIYFITGLTDNNGKVNDHIIAINLLQNNTFKIKKIRNKNLIGGEIIVFNNGNIVLLEINKKINSITLCLLDENLNYTDKKKNLKCDYADSWFINKNDLLYIHTRNLDEKKYCIYNSNFDYINYINIDMNIDMDINRIINIVPRLNEDYIITQEKNAFGIQYNLYYIDTINNRFIYLYTYTNLNNFDYCIVDNFDNIYAFKNNTITKIKG